MCYEADFLPYVGRISQLLERQTAELDLPCLVRIMSRMSVNHKNRDHRFSSSAILLRFAKHKIHVITVTSDLG